MSSSGAAPRDVWALIDAEPAAPDDLPPPTGWLQRLCRAASHALPPSVVALTIGTAGAGAVRLAASGPRADLLAQLQFTLGEGPAHDALRWGRPVLVPDVDELPASRWPGYAPALRQHAVQAVFVFPLRMGAVMLGSLDVYCDAAGDLTPAELSQALAFSAVAVTALVDATAEVRTGLAEETAPRDDLLNGRAELYQAQGMVKVQLGVSLEEAMARLRAYAYAHDRPLTDVAQDVVARRITLERDS